MGWRIFGSGTPLKERLMGRRRPEEGSVLCHGKKMEEEEEVTVVEEEGSEESEEDENVEE